jgi:uncharacterized protein involved in type VI secretion and phage assembly
MTALMPSTDLARHVGKYYGKYSGVVVENNDPQQLGRIEVSVPSVFPEDLVRWARPCFASGHLFVPPIDARVWVEFEAGDVRFPLWVGTWYPEGTVPPEADKAPPTSRIIHTPSGHLVEFSDEDGEEKIVIRHKGDSFVSIDKDGSVLAANKNGSYLFLNADAGEASLTSEQGHMVTLGSAGIVAVHNGGARVEVGDGKVKVVGGDAVQLVTKEVGLLASSVALGANAQFSLIVGELFQPIYSAHVHPTAMGPSGPPVPVPLNPAFSRTVKVQS